MEPTPAPDNTPTAPVRPRSSRLVFVDRARSIAIALALLAHALGYVRSVGVFENALARWVSLMTAAATPTFIILFGMMVELVYVKRAERDGLTATARRLCIRSAQCYFGYLVITAGAVIGGDEPLAALWGVATFTDSFFLGSILRFYVFSLLAVIPLLWVRLRLGLATIPALGVAAWALASVMQPVPFLSPMLSSFLFGTGSYGPSVLHGFILIAIGMGLGWALRPAGKTGDLSIYWRTLGAVTAAAVLVIGGLFVAEGISPEDFLGRYIRGFRGDNHPAYYAIGTVMTCGLLAALTATRNIDLGRVGALVGVLGTSSLVAYSVGNFIIASYPAWGPYQTDRFWPALAASLALALLAVPATHLVRIIREAAGSRRPQPRPVPVP